MNEIDKEYILNQLNDGYIDLGIHDEKEIEYLKLVVSNYENLQSKIDKAIDKINQYELIVGYYDSNYNECDDTYSYEIKDELLDILKEAENVENN